MTYTLGIYTLGCKVNQYESEAIAEKAAKIEGVDYVLGSRDKMKAVDAALSLVGKPKPPKATVAVRPTSEYGFEEMEIEHFPRTRAYIKIEDGCESHCTYCIIPKARGKMRVRLGSLDPSLIKPAFVEKIAPLSENNDGLLEICLVKPISIFRFLSLIGDYKNGTHLSPKYEKIITYRRARKVEVFTESDDSLICIDGEIDRSRNFTVEVLPGAVKFAAPLKVCAKV